MPKLPVSMKFRNNYGTCKIDSKYQHGGKIIVESMKENSVNVNETVIFNLYPDVLATLLKDHTTKQNIFWATDSYTYMGEGFKYNDAITIEHIIGKDGMIIRPRSLKNRVEQNERTKDMAEVFTPSWICNAQNNLIDEVWFGKNDTFNTEYIDEHGCHRWRPTSEKIQFPEGKTWKDYVRDKRIEITCGEAPYVVSRYDTTTGEAIPLEQRIGLLDRKLRVVGENTETSGKWLEWVQEAYKSIYAYEWQGDNLLLARESMLISFIEYYQQKFGKNPLLKSIKYIAYIISWNVWQMDGLRGVVPCTCSTKPSAQLSMFGDSNFDECFGCKNDNIKKHNGTYARIKDWGASKTKQIIRFIDLIK